MTFQKRTKWPKTISALLASAVVLPLLLADNSDAVSSSILYYFLLCPLILITILLIAAMQKRRLLFVAAMLYLAISFVCFLGRDFLRYHERWLMAGEPYRSQVLAQPRDQNGLQHVVWDDWGGFGAPPTLTYLVFDSTGKLAHQRLRDGAAVAGVPCDVWNIHRLGSGWYSLTFYTGSFWENCRFS